MAQTINNIDELQREIQKCNSELEELLKEKNNLKNKIFNKTCFLEEEEEIISDDYLYEDDSENNLKVLFNLHRYLGRCIYQWDDQSIYVVFNSADKGIYSQPMSLHFIKTSQPYKFKYKLPFNLPNNDIFDDDEALKMIEYAWKCFRAYLFRKNQCDNLSDYLEENNIEIFTSGDYRLVELTFNNMNRMMLVFNYKLNTLYPVDVNADNFDFEKFRIDPEEMTEIFQTKYLRAALETLFKPDNE